MTIYERNHDRENFDSAGAFTIYGRLIKLHNAHISGEIRLNDYETGLVSDLLDRIPRSFTDAQRRKIGQICLRYNL